MGTAAPRDRRRRSGQWSIVTRYLDQIARIPLLADREQLELGRRIDAGERAALAAVLASTGGRAELGRIGHDLEGALLRTCDVVHVDPQGEPGAEHDVRAATVELLRSAARRTRSARLDAAAIERLVRARLARGIFRSPAPPDRRAGARGDRPRRAEGVRTPRRRRS